MAKEIQKYDFKEGLPQQIEIVQLSSLFASYDTLNLTSPHRTNFYHIFWFQKGTPTHFVDFKPYKIQEDSFLFLNKDVVHSFDENLNFDGKVIIFTDDFFCKTKSDSTYLKSTILF